MSKRTTGKPARRGKAVKPTTSKAKARKGATLSPGVQWGIVGGSVSVLLAAWLWFFQLSPTASSVSVTMPSLSKAAEAGRKAFVDSCAECHGEDAGGTANGPPLIHKIYRPGHHDDRSFRSAVQRGARQHHWGFGDMPPRPEVNDREIASIIRFVRSVQKANGIN